MKTPIKVEVVPEITPLVEWLREVGSMFNRFADELAKAAEPGAIQSLPKVNTVTWDSKEVREKLFWPEDRADG